MAKLPINPFLLLGRLSVTVHVKKMIVPTISSERVTAVLEKKKKEDFWVRDPKTGNWIPETQVGKYHAIDEVDLREKLLPKKNIV